MPDLTRNAPYYKVKRVIRQPDYLRQESGTFPRRPKHYGLGITLVWLNCNLFYQDDRLAWSATCSNESFNKAAKIDADVVDNLNKIYRLDDMAAPAANYDVNVLFKIVCRACHTPGHSLGLTVRMPRANQMAPIGDLHRLMARRSNFMGIVLRLSSLSATSGTIGIQKTSQDTKIFTHSVGEYTVSNDLLIPFINYTFLSSLSPIGGFANACIFKVDPLAPISKSKKVTDTVAESSGTSGSFRYLND